MILQDALGRSVSISLPPRRLISLSPATTENLFAIGAGKYVVGRTTACDYPQESQKISTIGDFYRPTLERILTLSPDLIVFDSNTVNVDDADALQRKLKTPIYVFQTMHYTQISMQLATMASWFNETRILSLVKKQQRILLTAQKRAQSRKKSNLRALIEINQTPLFAAGEGAFVSDLLTLLGIQNAVKGKDYPQISREQLFTLNPDIYIIAMPEGSKKERTFTSPIDKIKAVQKQHVYMLPPDHLLRPTPRLALGLETLAKLLPV